MQYCCWFLDDLLAYFLTFVGSRSWSLFGYVEDSGCLQLCCTCTHASFYQVILRVFIVSCACHLGNRSSSTFYSVHILAFPFLETWVLTKDTWLQFDLLWSFWMHAWVSFSLIMHPETWFLHIEIVSPLGSSNKISAI